MRYHFGRCYVDTASREVAANDVATHLSPKAFTLLCCLLDARPRVVTKAELMDQLWPGVFVVEGNLPVLVREVRTALGDAGTARVIRTHHRIGYAFAAEVSEERADAPANVFLDHS